MPEDKKAEYEDAAQTVKILDEEKSRLQTTYDEWDDKNRNLFNDLADYWDMLQTGRVSHTGKMWDWHLGKAKNKKLDTKTIFQEVLDRRTLSRAS